MIEECLVSHEDKDNCHVRIFRDGELINEAYTELCFGENLSNKHTEITAFDLDFGIHTDDFGNDHFTEIGKLVVIPDMIESTVIHSSKPGFILVNFEHGAGYWIKHDEFLSMLMPQEFDA